MNLFLVSMVVVAKTVVVILVVVVQVEDCRTYWENILHENSRVRRYS